MSQSILRNTTLSWLTSFSSAVCKGVGISHTHLFFRLFFRFWRFFSCLSSLTRSSSENSSQSCPIPTSHMFLVIVRWWYNRIPRLLISSTPGPWVQTIRTPLPDYCNGLRANPTLVLSNPIFPNSSESPKISRMLCPKHSTAFHFSQNKNWVLTLVKTPHGIWALLAL